MTLNDVRQLFAEMVSRHDADIDLAEAALLIAQEAYPRLNRSHYQQRLDRLAAEAGRRIAGVTEPYTIANTISEHLFDEEGFRGNVENYYDPRNSFLNEVLDRRLGIPITLSLVYIEVARRLRLPVVGVGMPGHFVVKFIAPAEEIVIDPFHRGLILSEEDCAELVLRTSGGAVTFQPEHLRPVSNKAILSRLLHNLKGIYLGRQDYRRALGVVERLLLIDPDSLLEVRDRGLLRHRLGDLAGAVLDLETYVDRAPTATDAARIRNLVEALWRQMRQQGLDPSA